MELVVYDVTVLNTVTRPLPFLIGDGEAGDGDAPREELRLRHRVLDLRRAPTVQILKLELVKSVMCPVSKLEHADL